MVQLFDLSDRAALVTGASRGLGRHFALTLARAGARVALAARGIEPLQALAREIEAQGGKACTVGMDVTNAASVEAGFEAAAQALGPITVVVNNAGTTAQGPALDLPERDWDEVIATNLKGPWLVAQEAARRLVASKRGGSIINIVSVLALRVTAQLAPYAASKAGLLHLTRALALEWARHGIRVNALAPGYIETEMNREFFASPAGEAMVTRIPQRRLGTPEDLDGALLLLASEASRYMTGSAVVVDGGHLQSSL